MDLDARFDAVRRGPMGRHLPPQDGPATANVRRWIARELVNEAILRHETGASSCPSEPSTGDIERLVADVTRDVKVTEDDVLAYYERNPDLYRRVEARRVRHVVVGDETRAQRLARRMAGNATLEGADEAPAATDVRRGELAGALEEALFQAPEGAVVGPIRTELGWHVARIEAVIPESRVPYAEARTEIEAEVLTAARIRAFEGWLERRRAELAVFEPEFEHPGHPIHGLASHRH